MTLDELESAVQQWSRARGIIPNATPESQLLKAVSEMGELADAVNKGQFAETKDAIGDVTVCLINLCAIEGTTIAKCLCTRPGIGSVQMSLCELEPRAIEWAKAKGIIPKATSTTVLLKMVSEMGDLVNAGQREEMKDAVGNVVLRLINLAYLSGSSLRECLELAYSEIKDRKGRLLPNGTFVKEVME